MKELVESAVYTIPAEDIEEKLHPHSIVEYAGTFDIQRTEETDDGVFLTVVNEEVDPIIKQVLKFEEHEEGYVYYQVGDGVFDEMITEVVISEDKEEINMAHVTVRSRFTFGGLFAPVKDWLATGLRREEMQRLLLNLSHDLEANENGDD